MIAAPAMSPPPNPAPGQVPSRHGSPILRPLVLRLLIPLLVLLLAVLAGGWYWSRSGALPEEWKTTRIGRFQTPMEDVWKVVIDLEKQAEWWPALARVEKQPDTRGHAVWKEVFTDGETRTLETVETLLNRRFIRCVVDQDGPYGGCVIFEISGRDDGSALTMTESLRIRDPLFRLTRSRSGRIAARLDGYLLALGEHFGNVPRLGNTPREVNTTPIR